MAKLFSNAKAIRDAKAASKQVTAGAVYGLEASSAQAARQIAGQEAQANIFNALGQEGTYGQDAGTFQYGDGSTNMWDADAQWDPYLKQFSREPFGNKARGRNKKDPWNRKGIIDPEGYANQVIGSIPFQIRSKQTAEALQLLNKEGPAWDELENATIGLIYEGAALQLRDTMRQLKNNYAKGGTARRTAINEFSTIMAQERAMQSRVQETWQANLRLHSYVRKNADRVEAGNRSFVENINGLSSAHMAAMQATAALQVEAGKTAGLLAGQAYEIRASQQAVNFGTSLLEGVIQLAASAVLGGAGGALISNAAETGDSGGFQSGVGSLLQSAGTSLFPTTAATYNTEQQAAVDRISGVNPTARATEFLGTKNTTSGNVNSPFTTRTPAGEGWRIST